MGKTTKANDTILAAALEYAARGWVIFPARFELDKKSGKWEKKSWKSAKTSNGQPWGMTKDPNGISSRLCKIVARRYWHPNWRGQRHVRGRGRYA